MRGELKTGLIVVAAILAIIVVGTVGYTLIEGWSLLDSLYMTVTTIFTVGFGEVHPLSQAGQIFTLLLIVGGVGTILYGIGRMVEFVIGGQLTGVFRRRAVRRQVDKLDAHFIICGYGRVGEAVARHFAAHSAPFVVVDSDPESVSRAEADGFLAVHGDATADEVLQIAGRRAGEGPGGGAWDPTRATSSSRCPPGCSTRSCSSWPGRARTTPSASSCGPAPTTWSPRTASAASAWPP